MATSSTARRPAREEAYPPPDCLARERRSPGNPQRYPPLSREVRQFAGRRGFYPGLIDGARDPSNRGFEINLRYNTNTLEQVVLAAIAWSGLALALPQERLVLIPAMAFLFVAGRITFWIGYFINPLARSFGMVLTALPTIGAYAWLVWHWSTA